MAIALIEFSVENFKIFKDKVTFSMLTRKGDYSFKKNGRNLLKTSLIYGPNASGKSTLLDAFGMVRNGVIKSAHNEEGTVLPYFPFILSSAKNKPSFYEVVFSLDKKVFKYNFSILKDKIVTENLFRILSTGEEKKYLIRKEQNIKLFADFERSGDIKIKTRKEVLFLSAASQWNNELAVKIVEGFKNINVISGSGSEGYRGYTMGMFKKDIDNKKKILDLLRKADFCISDGVVEKMMLPDSVKKQISSFKEVPDEVDTMYFLHDKFDSKNKKIGSERINMGNESAGTRRFFDILGPVIDTLENGKILLIDELDNSLHPFLAKLIIDLFEKSNPKNAQLIVTTHDTSLLSYKKGFSKDHFWFTEKDKFGAGSLFSLAEFSLRNDTEFSKKYLEGRFGALPFIETLV